MNREFNTLELARIYESQGYYEDAFEMYQHLSLTDNSNEINSALRRMEKRLAKSDDSISRKKVTKLLKEYFSMLALDAKFDRYKNTFTKP